MQSLWPLTWWCALIGLLNENNEAGVSWFWLVWYIITFHGCTCASYATEYSVYVPMLFANYGMSSNFISLVRAKIEKEYGEKLMTLARTASGKDEIGWADKQRSVELDRESMLWRYSIPHLGRWGDPGSNWSKRRKQQERSTVHWRPRSQKSFTTSWRSSENSKGTFVGKWVILLWTALIMYRKKLFSSWTNRETLLIMNICGSCFLCWCNHCHSSVPQTLCTSVLFPSNAEGSKRETIEHTVSMNLVTQYSIYWRSWTKKLTNIILALTWK